MWSNATKQAEYFYVFLFFFSYLSCGEIKPTVLPNQWFQNVNNIYKYLKKENLNYVSCNQTTALMQVCCWLYASQAAILETTPINIVIDESVKLGLWSGYSLKAVETDSRVFV